MTCFIWLLMFSLNTGQPANDSTYTEWQRKTLLSLHNQMEGISAARNERRLYESKYAALKQEIEDGASEWDFRYLFLKQMNEQYADLLKKCIVIEVVKHQEVSISFEDR